jgi:hypothetical protein
MSQENREEVAVNREMMRQVLLLHSRLTVSVEEVVLLSRELVLFPLQGERHLP